MKYGTILIDPPWGFKTFSEDAVIPTQGAQPYKAMSLGEIAALPLPEIMARDCAVFLWDNDSLPDTVGFLTTAWGLRLGTRNVFVWYKGPRIGMGYYSRKQCEVCHLLVRGRPKRKSKAVRQFIESPRREHSRKPDEQYGRIEELFDGPYIEFFARQRWPGWDAWGDEVGKFDGLGDLLT